MFQGSLLVILLWPKPDVNIPNIFDRFHPWTSDFQISMRQKYWRFRLTLEIVKVRLSAVCKQSFLSDMPRTLYKTFAWQTFASLRLFTCLVYVSTYCVPIAHLGQNKPFPLLYLGHAQIITANHILAGERNVARRVTEGRRPQGDRGTKWRVKDRLTVFYTVSRSCEPSVSWFAIYRMCNETVIVTRSKQPIVNFSEVFDGF